MAFFHITLQELVSFRLELTLSIYSRAPDFILIIRIPNVTRQAGFGYEIWPIWVQCKTLSKNVFRWYKSRTLAWNWLNKVLVSNYLFKFSNKNTEKRCDICSKLTIKSPEQRQWRGPGAFIVNFELNNAVNFKTSYQTNRIKRCKINNSFSEWAKISAGFSRGFVLGPLLFNIFINEISSNISSKVWPSKLCWWQYYAYLRKTCFSNCRFPETWIYYSV